MDVNYCARTCLLNSTVRYIIIYINIQQATGRIPEEFFGGCNVSLSLNVFLWLVSTSWSGWEVLFSIVFILKNIQHSNTTFKESSSTPTMLQARRSVYWVCWHSPPSTFCRSIQQYRKWDWPLLVDDPEHVKWPPPPQKIETALALPVECSGGFKPSPVYCHCELRGIYSPPLRPPWPSGFLVYLKSAIIFLVFVAPHDKGVHQSPVLCHITATDASNHLSHQKTSVDGRSLFSGWTP